MLHASIYNLSASGKSLTGSRDVSMAKTSNGPIFLITGQWQDLSFPVHIESGYCRLDLIESLFPQDDIVVWSYVKEHEVYHGYDLSWS